MPWFRIDDKAHSHPKLIKAGNAALGLWLRCGSYAAQHLTDGIVPGVVAELYGTKPQAAKLIKAGLWHEHGHDCPDGCPNPAPGDYVFHDFLEDGRNTSRARAEAERKKARDRQSKHREGARGDRRGDRKGDGNAGESKDFTFDSSSKKSESVSENSQSSDSGAGQRGLSRRDASVTGIHAGATPYPSTSYGSTGAAGEQRSDGLPDPLTELKRGIANAGLAGVAWDLRESGWEYTRQAMDRVGVAAMVAFAVNSARLKGVPAGASAWVQGWRTLEAPEEQGDVTYLPAAVGQTSPVNRQQQETNDMFDRAMARAKARRQQQEES